jgi:hydroxymethylbilane synthase
MDSGRRLVVGTRGSALALWQARHVRERLAARHPDAEIVETIVRTAGDRNERAPLDTLGVLGGTGIFVREIEEALLAGTIDLAVHSLKDLPTEPPRGLTVAAVPERHDPRDALLSAAGASLEGLPHGATVATGSARRRSQLSNARSDLRMVPVRGNVDTRVGKLVEKRFDALVLALAGIERLGIRSVPVVPIPPEVCLPAVGQGALAIEIREDDAEVRGIVSPLTHDETLRTVLAERAFLRRLGGGCLAPATAYARLLGDRIRIDAFVGDPDGRRVLRDSVEGPERNGERLGEDLATRLLEAGGAEILSAARAAVEGRE